MKQRTKLSDDEISELSDSMDIDEEYLLDSVQSRRADHQYEESVVESSEESTGSSWFGKIKNGMRFVKNCFYPVHTVPNTATVINVNSPEDTSNIEIETKTEFSNIYVEYEETQDVFTKEHILDLSKSKNKEIIEKLLNYAGVNQPSELEGEKVPVRPSQNHRYTKNIRTRERRHKFYDFDHSIDVTHSNMTILNVLKRHINRILMKVGCIERKRKDNRRQGLFALNRNILLILAIIPFVIGFLISSHIVVGISGLLTSIYLYNVIISLLAGLYEVLSKNEENRDRIKAKINK